MENRSREPTSQLPEASQNHSLAAKLGGKMASKAMKTGTAKGKDDSRVSTRDKAVQKLAEAMRSGIEHLPEEEQDKRIQRAEKRLNDAS